MSDSIDNLKYILDSVNSWLKFAESKNGALLVFNIGVIFGVVRILMSSTITMNVWIQYFLISCLFFLIVSACICLISFIPKIETPSLFIGKIAETNGINVLFYGHPRSLYSRKIFGVVRKRKYN